MRLGDIANEDAQPLRQAARRRAHPRASSRCRRCRSPRSCWPASAPTSSRSSTPSTASRAAASMPGDDRPRRPRVGATFLRNNLDKRSVGIDLKQPEGQRARPRPRAALRRRSPRTSRRGTLTQLGLGYDDVAAVHPRVIYLSVSGFGNTVAVALRRVARLRADRRGDVAASTSTSARATTRRSSAPVGALGDIGSALFGTIGVLAALRHRDRTGEGQYVDIAMSTRWSR